MQRTFDKRNNGSVVDYIGVLVTTMNWSGLVRKRRGQGV